MSKIIVVVVEAARESRLERFYFMLAALGHNFNASNKIMTQEGRPVDTGR
jgi:hypothetical protein